MGLIEMCHGCAHMQRWNIWGNCGARLLRGAPASGCHIATDSRSLQVAHAMYSSVVLEETVQLLHTVKSHPFLVLAVFLILRLLFKRYASPLRNVSGPFTASFTRLWKLRQMYKGDMEQTNIDLHRKYGNPKLHFI
jgi:hypothetical protein